MNNSQAVALAEVNDLRCAGDRGWNHQTIREVERASILQFVTHASLTGRLNGRVLDFGAGKPGTCAKPQPYRDLVTGEYHPYDLGDPPPPVGVFDTVLCTQVAQYVDDVPRLIVRFREFLRDGGALVMTYPTSWDEVETSDLWRFTKAGMERLLGKADFTIETHVRRAEIDLGGFKFPLGYGVIATN